MSIILSRCFNSKRTLAECCFNVGPASETVGQRYNNVWVNVPVIVTQLKVMVRGSVIRLGCGLTTKHVAHNMLAPPEAYGLRDPYLAPSPIPVIETQLKVMGRGSVIRLRCGLTTERL